MKTVAIAQARMGSTRLPGKILKPLNGRPVLDWVVVALRAVPSIDQVVIATSTLEADDVVYRWCVNNGVYCFRGSETDVLDRYYQTAKHFNADIVLRLTADCPFLDPYVVGQVIQLRQMTGAAYCCNNNPPVWPDGLDTECFTFEALEYSWKEATRPSDRDCVTQFIIRNRDIFPAESLVCPFPGMDKERWVLDTERDYALCQAIATRWGKNTPPSCMDIVRILDNKPSLRELNRDGIRNERFYQQLAKEDLGDRSYARSDALLTRAKKTIPFASQTYSKSYLHFPAGAAPLFVSHGDGARVYDVDGNDYVDLVSALLPVVLGYRDPDVDYAVRRQLSAGMSFSLATKLEAELSEKLVSLIPCAEMVKFGKSGTDVTTSAVRLARAYTGRDHVLVGGYHGWADWSMARSRQRIGIPTAVAEKTILFNYGEVGNILAYWEQWAKIAAAVIVEPTTDPNYLQWLRDYCSHNGIILIFDEIKTGFRYDMGGAQKLFNVIPDLACFGKSMANGMPISALVGKRDIMKAMEPPDGIFYSGTFFGDTTAIAAALATIKKMEDCDVIKHLWETGILIRSAAQRATSHHKIDAVTFEGEAPLVQIKFHDHEFATANQIKALFIQEMAEQGVLVLSEHGVSYAHKEPEVERICNAYHHTMETISLALDGGIEEFLRGQDIKAKPVRETA